MQIVDLLAYLRANVPYQYIANDFTPAADSAFGDAYAIVRLTGGYAPSEWTPKKRPSFQVVVRGSPTGQAQAEAKVNEILNHFHNRSGYFIGNTRVVHSSADQSTPIYLGQDSDKRPLYSINFTLTTL